MSPMKPERTIQTRRQLFDFLQSQMQVTFTDLKENRRFSHESSLIKSYIFEANLDQTPGEKLNEWLRQLSKEQKRYQVSLIPTDEDAFFQLHIKVDNRELRLYLDAATDTRFWLAYSISESQILDRWIETIVRRSIDLDFVWLWPNFLQRVQQKGFFRGFGLDYDYRKFEVRESEATTYLKMQLWGGENTQDIYETLQNHTELRSKVVLSKVRFKQMGSEEHNSEIFAIQDVKYNGKFTTRGTDLNTHLVTLNEVRNLYREQILHIEDRCSLKWIENTSGGVSLEGYAIHFIPDGFEIPVALLVEKLFDGTEPFRLLGFPNLIDKAAATVEVVDLHTGGKLSMQIFPDRITIYLPEHTCGNTIARLYTNIQHTFNVGFRVETDHGEQLFD